MKSNMLSVEFKKCYDKGYDTGMKKGMCETVKNYSAVTLLCLKDHFDFTTEQLEQMSGYINNYFDSVCKGLVSLHDVKQALQDENGIKIRYVNEKVQLEINDIKEDL